MIMYLLIVGAQTVEHAVAEMTIEHSEDVNCFHSSLIEVSDYASISNHYAQCVRFVTSILYLKLNSCYHTINKNIN